MNGFLSLLRGAYPWFWLAVALVCGVVEAMTLSLTTIWFSLSAFVLILIQLRTGSKTASELAGKPDKTDTK